MKSTLVLILSALAATSVAQDRKDYFPECSMKCLDDAIKKATNCSLDDAVCMCVQKNYEDIYNQGVNCVMQACGPDDSIGMYTTKLRPVNDGAPDAHTDYR